MRQFYLHNDRKSNSNKTVLSDQQVNPAGKSPSTSIGELNTMSMLSGELGNLSTVSSIGPKMTARFQGSNTADASRSTAFGIVATFACRPCTLPCQNGGVPFNDTAANPHGKCRFVSRRVA